MIRLLVVEDSALMRKLLGRIFAHEGDFIVEFARHGADALDIIPRFRPDVITLDVNMPEMDGLTCLDRIMLDHPCPVVMLSSLSQEGADETLAALNLGAVDFVAKPQGAISLGIDEVASLIVQKVRMAATIRIRNSRRLAERLRKSRFTEQPANLQTDRLRKSISDPNKPGLVMIGSSTGGPPALDVVLSQLPADFHWPVVVAQHMPASFTGSLARRLNKLCPLSVSELNQQTRLVSGNIYIAKGDADIVISSRSGSLVASAAPCDARYRWHPSVDRMVLSALDHVVPSNLIGVLMTGMGNDGASSMAELHIRGGYTIAESEETAVVWGMPGELVKAHGANDIRPVQDIASSLLERVGRW